jgi:hypothetical protein
MERLQVEQIFEKVKFSLLSIIIANSRKQQLENKATVTQILKTGENTLQSI